uniref:Phosphotransferase n=1 Tax=Ditylenchus dipsaci TaxID=166011 RepID=A0A915E408_9BILA
MNFVRTKYDRALDEKTINVGQQLMEKMISGMYMGELVRIVLEHLAKEGGLFKGDYDAISQKGCFPTKFVSEIESEMQEEEDTQFAKTQQILEEIGISVVTPQIVPMWPMFVLWCRQEQPTCVLVKIDELVDGKLEFQLMLSEDGSGRGAALVAAVATRMAEERLAAASAAKPSTTTHQSNSNQKYMCYYFANSEPIKFC